MSSALTGNKIKDSYQALLKMGTNGSLDPITPIVISDGLGNDTPILLSRTEFKTQVVSAAKLYGIWADLSANSHLAIGDYAGQYNGTQLYVNDSARLIQTYGGAGKGFKLNFTNNLYDFGDYDNAVNGAYLRVDTANQTILTKNGPYDKGLKIDFLTDFYYFGDYNNVNFNSALNINGLNTYALAELYADTNLLSLCGSNNTILGVSTASFYNDDINLNSNNYAFGTDWLMENDDLDFPFQFNTVLNCYNNGLSTYEKNMKYNLFVNIQDPNLDLGGEVLMQDKKILSNCFIFGLTDFIGSNGLGIYSEDPNSLFFPTNVLILNGSGLEYQRRTNNVFSVNASEVITAQDTSGLVILGGDYYDKDSQSYVTANHRFDTPGNIPYGISIQGNKALVKNTFTRVVANSFEDNTTARGKVQIEEKQLYKFINPGDSYDFLLDSKGDNRIFLQSNASYFIELKIVSVSSSTVQTSSSGNWVRYIGGLICVDASGVLTKAEKTIAQYGRADDMAYNIDISNNNYFIIEIKPDTASGNGCLVKADVKISCVTKN
jgi:hypothetical protein